jgi:hypothetical protein
VRTDSMIGVTKIRIGKLKLKHGAEVDEKYLWDSLRPIIPYPTGRFFRAIDALSLAHGRDAFPGTSCQATIVLSLPDKNHSPIEALALSQRLWVETLG